MHTSCYDELAPKTVEEVRVHGRQQVFMSMRNNEAWLKKVH